MKKLIFTALSTLALMNAFAQVITNDRLVDKTYPNEKLLKASPSYKMLNNSAVFSKSGPALGQWFSNEDRLINYGTPIDSSSSNPSVGTYRISYPFMANDSFVRIAYYDAQNSKQTFYGPYYHNIGYLFDGRSPNYKPFPGTTSTLSNFTPYSIDSVQIAYVYERFNTSPVADTLLFQVFYSDWSTNDTNQNTPFVDAWYPAPSTEAISTVDYNYSTNLGTLRNGTAGFMRTIKVPLTAADTLSNVKTIAISPIQNLKRRTRFAVTYKFNPAVPYAYGDTINGDSNAMIIVKKRNSSFRPAMISDYSAYSEGDNRVQPYVDRIHNLGLLVRTATRYHQGNPADFFYNRYYSAGFTTTVGSLNLNIFPYMSVYVNNVTNSGINEVKNGNLISSTIYPNPSNMNGAASVVINLKSSSKVAVDIYNLMGQLVKTVANKNFDGGENTIDMNLAGLNAGVYLVNINVNGVTQTKKLTIVQ